MTLEPEVEFLAPRHDVPKGGRSGFVIIQDRQVHYLEWGRCDAPPVVCLHGGGQTAYMYEELGAALASHYHVLAPELPGHGDSDPIETLARQDLAATLPPLLDEFGIGRAVFVGASLGGLVTLTLAGVEQERIAAIALIDIGHRLEDEGVNRIVDFMRKHESFASLDEAAREVAEYLPQRREVRVESLKRNLRQRPDGRWEWKHVFSRRLRAAGDAGALPGGWRRLVEGLDDELRELQCPVLVLRGSASDVLSSEGAEEVAALIPDAQVKTVKNAGHLAAGDNPESTVGLIVSFLGEVGW